MCCRMAPSKNARRGRVLRPNPVAARSRAAATCAAMARSAISSPTAEYNVVQNVEDEPALQQVVRRVSGTAEGRRGTTEEHLSSMERSIEASDNMLQEVHAMVRGLQQRPATSALPAPPPPAVLYHGQTLYHLVSIQLTRYTLSPGHLRI